MSVLRRITGLLKHRNCAGLLALLAVSNFELYFVTFVQGTIACGIDARIVNEYISAVFRSDKAVALFTIEPLNGALDAVAAH